MASIRRSILSSSRSNVRTGPPRSDKRGRMWLLGGLIAAILALAWFDGGEEPLRAISHEIPVPEGR